MQHPNKRRSKFFLEGRRIFCMIFFTLPEDEEKYENSQIIDLRCDIYMGNSLYSLGR